jgi:hypothetical protein
MYTDTYLEETVRHEFLDLPRYLHEQVDFFSYGRKLFLIVLQDIVPRQFDTDEFQERRLFCGRTKKNKKTKTIVESKIR